MRKIMASLDIGSGSMKLVVGELYRNRLNVLVSLTEELKGFKDGLLVNEDKFIDSIKKIMEKASEIVGIKIKQMIITIPPRDLEFSVITGKIKVNSEEGIVAGIDVSKVFKESLKGQIPKDREFVSLIPTSFGIDDGRKVRNPKGLKSKNLSARGVLITAPKDNIYPIITAFDKLGIDILDISLSSIGDYYEYKIDEMKEKIGIIVDIGYRTTDISLFNKGVLTNTININIGAKNVENDLEYVFKVNDKDAKFIKDNFALAYVKNASESKTIELTDKYDEKIKLNELEVTKIVQSRIEEILNLCKKQINLLTKREISYIIITGGLTEIRDFRLIQSKIFKEKTIVGRVTELGIRHNKYGAAVGLIKYYADKQELKGKKEFSIFSIEEQQALGGYNLDEDNTSAIAKLFGF